MSEQKSGKNYDKKAKIFFIESSSNFGHLRWWQDRWIVLSSKKERRKEKDGKINRTKFSSASVLLFCGKKRRTLQKVPLLVPLFYFHSKKKCPITLNPLLHSSACTQIFFHIFISCFADLRKVYPYYFTFTTFTKGRWVGERILDVFAREFRAHPAEEYVRIEYYTLSQNPLKSLQNEEKTFFHTCWIFFLISNQTYQYCAWAFLILLHQLR